MVRSINRLSARRVQTTDRPGRYADGGGLYLVVTAAGTKRWAFIYARGGRQREMGLGSTLFVTLARARDLADGARRQLAYGLDPIDARQAATKSTPSGVVTFGNVALQYMADRESSWRNAVHRRQWRQTLEVQAAALWSMSVAAVDTEAVLSVLRPIWQVKAETAKRIRGRIERVLDAARAAGLRSADNPARWSGHLAMLLPSSRKLVRGHHPAMPYEQVPTFMASLRMRSALSARALEFLILTAARSGEVRRMTWSEVDLNAAVWTVPAERMKAGRAHRVPLPAAAIEILENIRLDDDEPTDLVFEGPRKKPMSDMVFNALLRRMDQADVTAHGFRSSFRDWAGNETDFPRELAEAALAHLVGDETERAYRRRDALDRRRHLMEAWASYCAKKASSSE